MGGDTAQTIAKVNFRFSTVKDLLRTRQAVLKERGVSPLRDVQQLILRTNFRSHQGVLNTAQLPIDLLLRLFPNSIDRVHGAERAHFQGTPSLLFLDQDWEYILDALSGDSDGSIEFGAHQCIIVRDAAAKAKLPKQLQTGLVLTPREAKGLEFTTVRRRRRKFRFIVACNTQ